jgi:TfoX/Sxy family transcriptional regulator of competence genes
MPRILTQVRYSPKYARPFPDKPLLSMTYYAVPADTLEDAEECVLWARKSAVAAAAKSLFHCRANSCSANSCSVSSAIAMS